LVDIAIVLELLVTGRFNAVTVSQAVTPSTYQNIPLSQLAHARPDSNAVLSCGFSSQRSIRGDQPKLLGTDRSPVVEP